MILLFCCVTTKKQEVFELKEIFMTLNTFAKKFSFAGKKQMNAIAVQISFKKIQHRKCIQCLLLYMLRLIEQ